jgi:hypothetical protein
MPITEADPDRIVGSRAGETSALWLGALVSEAFLQEEVAASAAGVLWQSGLLEALVDQGMMLTILGGTPHSAWPRGGVRAPHHAASLRGGKLTASMTGYLNFPVVKLFSQHARLRTSIRALLHERRPPAVVFSYNAGLPEAVTARWVRSEFGTPWVSVLADYPESSDPRTRLARRLALQVYGRVQ